MRKKHIMGEGGRKRGDKWRQRDRKSDLGANDVYSFKSR